MEIETATQFTLAALTLKEKTLANDLLYNEQYSSEVHTVWRRAPLLKLNETVSKAREGAKEQGFNAVFIKLYCDTLVIEEGTKIMPEVVNAKPVGFEIEIYARMIVRDVEYDGPLFHVNFVEDSEITFWVPSLASSPIEFSYGTVKGTAGVYKLMNPAGKSGHSVRSMPDMGDLEFETYDAPDEAMRNIDYMSLINEDGTLGDRRYWNDDLPRLIQFLILVSEAHASSNRPLALSLLDCVIALTKDEQAFQLNYQACALRSGLTVESQVMNVPSVNIYASKQILKSRLVAALAFEDSFRNFLLAAENSSVQSQAAFNTLAKSQDAMKMYGFLYDIKKREYDNAVASNTKAEQTFKTVQDQLTNLGEKFEAGIKKYESKQIKAGVKKAAWEFFKLGVTIGSALATGGLTAASVVDSIKDVGKAAKDADGLLKKIVQVVQALKKIYDKIKPVLKNLATIASTINDVINAITKVNKATKKAPTLRPKIQSVDVFNATAEWRCFDIAVRDMETLLSEFEIEGKNEYFQALKTMVVQGETYILTQANLAQKGDDYCTILTQQSLGELDESRLSVAATCVAKNDAILNLLARAMFDRVLSIRHQVYFDFHTFIEAYRYHTVSDQPIVQLSPVKPIVDYLDDMARLRGAIAFFSSKTVVQQKPFKLKTLGQFENPQRLAEELSTGRPVSIVVTQGNPIWNGCERIRLSSARCWLEGVTTAADLPIRLQLSSDTQFYDRNPADDVSTLTSWTVEDPADVDLKHDHSKDEGYNSEDTGRYEEILASPPPSSVRRYVGDARKVVFEYQPSSKLILCDGAYGQERDYTKYTPMTKWSVQIVGHEVDTANPGEIDFSGFQGITMEFVCDFTWAGL